MRIRSEIDQFFDGTTFSEIKIESGYKPIEKNPYLYPVVCGFATLSKKYLKKITQESKVITRNLWVYCKDRIIFIYNYLWVLFKIIHNNAYLYKHQRLLILHIETKKFIEQCCKHKFTENFTKIILLSLL